MAKKERQKRSARQARQREREEREAAQAVTAEKADKASKKGDAVAASGTAKKETKPAKAKKPGRIRSYFREVRSEMRRVVWPNRQETRDYSVAVILMLVVFGLAVWAVDTGFISLLIGFTGLRG